MSLLFANTELSVWGNSGKLTVRNERTGETMQLRHEMAWFAHVQVSGTKIAYASTQPPGAVCFADVRTGESRLELLGDEPRIQIELVTMSRDATALVAVSYYPCVVYVCTSSGNTVMDEWGRRRDYAVDATCVQRNRACIAWSDGTVDVVNIDSKTRMHVVSIHTEAMDMTSDARVLITAIPRNVIALWDVESGTRLGSLSAAGFVFRPIVNQCVVKTSKDNTCVAVVSDSGMVRVFDLRTREVLVEIAADHRNAIRRLHFEDSLPDGTIFTNREYESGEFMLERTIRKAVLPIFEIPALAQRDGDHAIKCRVLRMLL